MNLALASLNLLKESGSRADAIIDIAEPEPGPDEDVVVEEEDKDGDGDEAPTAWEIREADPLVLDDDDDNEEEETDA